MSKRKVTWDTIRKQDEAATVIKPNNPVSDPTTPNEFISAG